MISICHPGVLTYYNENFDYHNEREFLKDLLYSEISSESVSIIELPANEYAVDVKSPHLLLKTNLDGLKWYIESMINFDATSSSKYRERLVRTSYTHSFYSKEAKLDFNCRLGANTLVLEGADIGPDSCIDNAVVLKRVVIRSKCSIERSLLATECVIGDNTLLRDAAIGSKAKIGNNCKMTSVVVEQGAVVHDNEILENVRVKNDSTKVPFLGKTLYSRQIIEDDFDFEFGQEEATKEDALGNLYVTRL